MGMNKQLKVTFNVTATLSDEQEAEFVQALKEMAKDPKRGPYFNNILVASLTHGPEGAFEQVLKQGLREFVKEELGKECSRRSVDEFVLKVAPAKVEVIR
ncbi:suppressor of silencing [Klebsiella phage vB_KpnP-VAC1]|uniref:Suppressor of silencing n=1 Tax=Klebsiella phage vB_KpnP-VAC1 TaxID=2864360 RepID=A0AAE7XIL0_9CAUD|nr:suppressor of silencing [Klebsiella phage vB_KpnP-VAC1]